MSEPTGFDLPDGYQVVGTPANVIPVVDLAAKQLLMKFESLGDNCEFGLLQRRFGAEPLGLLRWTATTVDSLVRLLNDGLSSFGEISGIELFVTPWGELCVREHNFGIVCHTFIHEKGVDRDLFLKQQGQKLNYLSGLLTSALREASKIFVYKSTTGIDETSVGRIHAAIRKYGCGSLLCVVPAGNMKSGTTKVIGDGLVMGYIDGLGPIAADGYNYWNIPYTMWTDICHAAIFQLFGQDRL